MFATIYSNMRDWLAARLGGLSFAFLLAATAVLGYYFVYRHADRITDKPGFFLLVVGLIAVAFLLSSVEAAFSISARDPAISKAINPDLSKIMQEWSTLVQGKVHIEALSRSERKQRNRLERRNDRIARIRLILMDPDGRRVDIVGALSALSVLANTALTAFLPFFLFSDDSAQDSFAGLIEWNRQKLLIFVASALPIIYFGKVVPKTIGLRYPDIFAYRLFRVGNVAFLVIGWMPLGLNWLLRKVGLAR